jgi:hypothetical protein
MLIRTRGCRAAEMPPPTGARAPIRTSWSPRSERTRESLAQTIDELAERVSPSSNIRRLRSAPAEAERPEVQLVIAAPTCSVVWAVVFRAPAAAERRTAAQPNDFPSPR